MVMERWIGKKAVVTGGCGAIGSAISQKLATAGLTVIVLDYEISKSQNLNGNSTMFSRKCDLTKIDEIKAAFQWIEENFGGVDLLVNCAGYAKEGHITNVNNQGISDDDVLNTMLVNTNAVIFCTRLAVDSMKNHGVAGHIVNINSVAGHYIPDLELFNVYATSKHAVTAFTSCLAKEFANCGCKIKTTSISPGLVETPLSADTISHFNGVSNSKPPILQPTDVADAVLYAVSTSPHVNISELIIQPVGEKLA